MKSCLICDDHAMMREALAGSVSLGWPDAVVSQAGDYPGAWKMAAALKPDLIISDLVMPGASPVDGIRSIHAAAPSTPILVVTGDEDDAILLALFDLGIAGFAPKTSRSAVIEAAIHLILAGGRYLPDRFISLAAERPVSILPDSFPTRLTQRQADVLDRISTGKSNKEIARDLEISPATVKAHTAAVILAMGAVNRTDAVHKARKSGLI